MNNQKVLDHCNSKIREINAANKYPTGKVGKQLNAYAMFASDAKLALTLGGVYAEWTRKINEILSDPGPTWMVEVAQDINSNCAA